MESPTVSAVLFVKDLQRATAFYAGAFNMSCTASDEHHSTLNYRGFNLIVHQIPKHIADEIDIEQPPTRRAESAIRLTFPVQSIEATRRLARALGGDVDEARPPWADTAENVFLGYDPEGNVFKVSQHA